MIHGWRAELAFAPLDSGERAEEIGRRLRRAIELGVLEDEAQLPSEAELAAQMRVSTQTLRAALAELRRQGLLETRRGRGGGSFVKAGSAGLTQANLEELAAFSLDALRDLRDYRAFLAGSAAAAAAGRASDIELARLHAMGTAIATTTDTAALTGADSRFHIELAAASRSVRLMKQEMAVQREIGTLLWIVKSRDTDAANVASQHAAIIAAVRAGHAEQARTAAEEHARDDVNHLIERRMTLDSDGRRVTTGTGHNMTRRRVVAGVQDLARDFAEMTRTTVETIESAVRMRVSTASPPSLDDLNDIHDIAGKLILESNGTIWGAGFITDAVYFGAPALLWSYRPSDSVIERLIVDPEFYGYTTAPWWPAAHGDDSLHATPAYVDASGTNEYIVTFSKRVDIDGTMIGAVATDLLVSQIQARFQPLLLALPPESSITDQDGVVIATNTGRLLGGTQKVTKKSSATALPEVPWLLHIGND